MEVIDKGSTTQDGTMKNNLGIKKTLKISPLLGVIGALLSAAIAAPPVSAAPSGLAGTALFEQNPFLYQGTIPLGMGGAFTAVADDENAVFYNPAGLDNIQTSSFKLINITADMTYPDFLNMYNSFKSDSNLSGTAQTAAFINTFNTYSGQSLYARVGDYSNYTTHDFSIGLLTNNQVMASANPVVTTNNLASIATLSDTGVVLSGAYGFMDHHLQIGGTLMGLEQYFLNIPELSAAQASSSGSSILTKNMTNGFGLDANIGAIYHFDLPLNPTIGATIQNIGSADFGAGGNIPEIINAGVGLDPDIGFGRLLFDIDYDDVGNYLYYTGDSLWLHTHMGIQYQFPAILTLSAGMYQGYPTVGVGVDLWAVEVNATYYTEEAGVVPGQNPDHIISLQVAFGWM